MKNFVLSIYLEYLANFISSGRLINRLKMSSIGIRPVFNRIVTKRAYKAVWAVCAVPVDLHTSITDVVRKELPSKCPNVRTFINMYIRPTTIEVEGDKFKRAMDSCYSTFQYYEETYNSLDPAKKRLGTSVYDPTRNGMRIHINERIVKSHANKYHSYDYIYSKVKSGTKFGYVNYFIECVAKDKKDFQAFEIQLRDMVSELGLSVTELYGNLSQYLMNYGPAGMHEEDLTGVNAMLFSSENITSLSPFMTKGLVGGQSKAVLFGLSFETKLPVSFSFTEAPTAQVIIIVGKAGHGKTTVAESTILSNLSLQHHVNVMDWKGGEYASLTEYAQSLIINMSETNSQFVNTLRLDDLSLLDAELAKELFDYAISGTVSILTILTNLQPKEGNLQDLELILYDAVSKLYSTHEVSPNNIESFKKTKGWTYDILMPIIRDLANSPSYRPEQKALIGFILTRCSPYMSDGRFASMFKNEVSLKDVLATPLVIYDFNKNTDNKEFGVKEALKVFMMSFLNNKKAAILKRSKTYTDDYYEEFQRTRSNPAVCKYISEKVTGSRSDYKNVWLMFNTLAVFNKTGDVTDMYVEAIQSNITTAIIGCLEDNDIKILKESFESKFKSIEHYVEQIKDHQEVLHNYFAIQVDTGKTRDRGLFKSYIPDYILERITTRSVE